jgi:hypothetical protein
MAIDRIPGVGPQNSDIATTIAVTPAVSAQITANVPSAASIASAVAAPSSATIQNLIQTYAAPASVTMAAITSSIVTNAASAGVTNASIAAAVAANASSQWSGTWTQLAYNNFGSASTTAVNVSSLTGYKSIRIITTAYCGSNFSLGLRFNGDTGNNYTNISSMGLRSGTSPYEGSPQWYTTPFINPAQAEAQLANNPGFFDLEIINSNSSTYKYVINHGSIWTNTGSVPKSSFGGGGIWLSTSQISSLAFIGNGVNITGGFLLILGGS